MKTVLGEFGVKLNKREQTMFDNMEDYISDTVGFFEVEDPDEFTIEFTAALRRVVDKAIIEAIRFWNEFKNKGNMIIATDNQDLVNQNIGYKEFVIECANVQVDEWLMDAYMQSKAAIQE